MFKKKIPDHATLDFVEEGDGDPAYIIFDVGRFPYVAHDIHDMLATISRNATVYVATWDGHCAHVDVEAVGLGSSGRATVWEVRLADGGDLVEYVEYVEENPKDPWEFRERRVHVFGFSENDQ